MSIESLKDKELNQSQIDIVSGGDLHDVDKEKAKTKEEVKCLYWVGRYVEVYDNFLHLTTERGLITDITIEYDTNHGGGYDLDEIAGYYYPVYSVRLEKTGETKKVISNDIESSWF